MQQQLIVEGDRPPFDSIFTLALLFVPIMALVQRIYVFQHFFLKRRIQNMVRNKEEARGYHGGRRERQHDDEAEGSMVVNSNLEVTRELSAFSNRFRMPTHETGRQIPLPRWLAGVHSLGVFVIYIIVMVQILSTSDDGIIQACSVVSSAPSSSASFSSSTQRHCILPAHPVLIQRWLIDPADTCHCAALVVRCGGTNPPTSSGARGGGDGVAVASGGGRVATQTEKSASVLGTVAPSSLHFLHVASCPSIQNNTDDLKRLAAASSLGALYLTHCDLSAGLPPMKSVAVLNLRGNRLGSMTANALSVDTTPNLKFLFLGDNALDALPQVLICSLLLLHGN